MIEVYPLQFIFLSKQVKISDYFDGTTLSIQNRNSIAVIDLLMDSSLSLEIRLILNNLERLKISNNDELV